ncbi:radical SAM protein [bacterium]|nr:radical SAM protein [bacterium]
MSADYPLIKKFRTEKNHYIYDTWTNAILKVEKPLWDVINENNGQDSKQHLNETVDVNLLTEEISNAKKKGFLSTDRPKVVVFDNKPDWTKIIKQEASQNLGQITLCVTEKCNFRCLYCPYTYDDESTRKHSQKNMSFNIAKQALDYGLPRSREWQNDGKRVSVGFYGGEPLLNFNLIRKCVDYINKTHTKENVKFNITTNGSILTENIVNFLVENQFNILLSCDGPAMIHDRYRVTLDGKPTHKLMKKGLKLLKKHINSKNISVTFNGVISPPYSIAEVEEYFESTNMEYRLALASSTGTQFYELFNMHQEQKNKITQENYLFSEYRKAIVEQRYSDISQYKRDRFEKDIIKIYRRNMVRMEKIAISHGQCNPGGRKLYVDVNGDFYPCERVSRRYIIGNIQNGLDYKKIYKLLEEWNDIFHENCIDCWALRFCSKCFTHFLTNDSLHKKTEFLKLCQSERSRWFNALVRFCAISEENENYFKTVSEYYSD